MTAAASVARELPSRALRGSLLWASRRRSLARVATATPLTRGMVWRFVAGETQEAGLDALARLREAGFRTTADVLGEAVSSEAMAARAADAYIRLLEGLAERGLEGNVSVKLTQLGLDHGIQGCRRQLLRVVEAAARTGAFVRVDMEDHHRTDATLALVHEMHATHPEVGAVIQAYLRRSADDVAALIAAGTRVRLCKGAYQEPASVAFPHKADVDTSY
ncbi:MAG TPA: proline dehydrogenase family protein, partial [Candidatus Baltobacteraceae bacterium]|nr:proline dehydrogenase family protein [Candidatus Baltobacteraceae bacterium]